MRFSQRIGKVPVTKLVQHESIDDDLRNSLWSLLTLMYWNTYSAPRASYLGERADFVSGSNLEDLVTSLWLHHFKKPIDTVDSYWPACLGRLRTHFFECNWAQAFDFVEFVADYGPEKTRERFAEVCNSYLERENSAYRFVGGTLAEITSQQEIEEVEAAVMKATPFAGVKTHLHAALTLMSDKGDPDYRNSIKESISAVESLARHLAAGEEQATLGAILKALERKQLLHPALRTAFAALYGYTSDAEGIRHALVDEPHLTKSDARFMLICCSAFVNYAIDTLAAGNRRS